MAANPIPVLFIPALLSDDAMYREVIERLRDRIDPRIMVLSEQTMQANVKAVWQGRLQSSSWSARCMAAASRSRSR